MIINFENLFTNIESDLSGNQKKIMTNSSLKVYYGLTVDGYFRVSFMSTILPPKIESTKDILVSQGQESENVYWTCFDLTNKHAKQVFYSFCHDLILAISGVYEEKDALYALKNRYGAWKGLFKGKKKMSPQTNQGLFGELFFLNDSMMNSYSQFEAIESWTGPDGFSKDFSINDTWYEIKTIGASSNVVKISSLSQLSSTKPGYLVIVKVEKMSEQFSDINSNVHDLFYSIMEKLQDNELKEKFIRKLLNYGFDIDNNENSERYKVQSIVKYQVDENFPRLLETDLKYQEICNVSYDLVLATLDKFKKE